MDASEDTLCSSENMTLSMVTLANHTSPHPVESASSLLQTLGLAAAFRAHRIHILLSIPQMGIICTLQGLCKGKEKVLFVRILIGFL